MRTGILCLALTTACATRYSPQAINERALLYALRSDDLPPGEAGGSGSGLSAEQAVAIALVRNPELAALRVDRRIAADQVVSSRAWKNPQLRAGLRGVLDGNPLELAAALRIYPPAPDQLAAERARAEARAERVDAEIEALENQIAADVLVAHARVILLDEKLAFTRAIRVVHDRLIELEKRRMEARVATRVDVAVAELERERSETKVNELVLERELALTRLAELLGTSRLDGLVLSRAAASTATRAAALPRLDERELEELAVRARPDLRALRALFDEHEQRTRLAAVQSGLWPEFIQPGLGRFPGGSARLELDTAIDLPVFDDPTDAVRLARTESERARGELVARMARIRIDIREALAKIRAGEREHARERDTIEPMLARAERLLEDAVASHEISSSKLESVAARILAARVSAAELRFEERRAHIALALATGTILDAVP